MLIFFFKNNFFYKKIKKYVGFEIIFFKFRLKGGNFGVFFFFSLGGVKLFLFIGGVLL